MQPKWAAMTAPAGSMSVPGNDDRHNQVDPNMGGGPQGMFSGNGKKVPLNRRGGIGTPDQRGRQPNGTPKPGTGNPASRGSTPHAFHPDKRIAGHGGSPQMSGKMGIKHRAGFGKSGQHGVPTYKHAHPQPKAGNTAGTTFKQISGHFQRSAMGARPTGDTGKYGSPPVGTNT